MSKIDKLLYGGFAAVALAGIVVLLVSVFSPPKQKAEEETVALQSDRSFGGDLAGCLVESNAVGIKRRFSVRRIFILDDDAVFCRSHAGIGIVRKSALFGRRLNLPLGALLSGKIQQGVGEEETDEEKPPDESHEKRNVTEKEGFSQVSCEKSRRLYPIGRTGSADVLPATPGV